MLVGDSLLDGIHGLLHRAYELFRSIHWGEDTILDNVRVRPKDAFSLERADRLTLDTMIDRE